MIGLSIVSNAGDQLVIQPHLYANHKGTEALFDIDELAAIVDGKVMHGRPTKLSGNTTQNTNFLRADAVTAFLEKTIKYNRWPHGAESIYDATLTASLEGVSLTGLCAYLQANSQRGNITPDSPITPKLRIILPENSGAQVPQGVAGAAQYPGTLRNSNGLMISSIEQGTSDLTTLDHS